VEAFVPNWIKQQVLDDNNLFLIDRHIYHESFFNFIKNTLRHVANNILTTQHQYKLDYLPEFHRLKNTCLKLASKTMFDMLAQFYYNTQMSDITSSLQTIFTFSDSAFTLNRGDPSLMLEFMKSAYLEDGFVNFFNIMFDCSDKTSRFYIGRVTSILINKIYHLYQDAVDKGQTLSEALMELKETADSFVVVLVKSLKSPECSKNWSKIEQFLKMIYDIATGGAL